MVFYFIVQAIYNKMHSTKNLENGENAKIAFNILTFG